MPINLTHVKFQHNNIKRNLFFQRGMTLVLLNINEVLAELTDGWYVSKNPEADLNIGGEWFFASISDTPRDDIDLREVIGNTNRVRFGSETYKAAQVFRPRQLTKEYLLRLEPQGTENG